MFSLIIHEIDDEVPRAIAAGGQLSSMVPPQQVQFLLKINLGENVQKAQKSKQIVFTKLCQLPSN